MKLRVDWMPLEILRSIIADVVAWFDLVIEPEHRQSLPIKIFASQ